MARREPGPPWFWLSDELKVIVMSYLDDQCLVDVSVVCSDWHRISTDVWHARRSLGSLAPLLWRSCPAKPGRKTLKRRLALLHETAHNVKVNAKAVKEQKPDVFARHSSQIVGILAVHDAVVTLAMDGKLRSFNVDSLTAVAVSTEYHKEQPIALLRDDPQRVNRRETSRLAISVDAEHALVWRVPQLDLIAEVDHHAVVDARMMPGSDRLVATWSSTEAKFWDLRLGPRRRSHGSQQSRGRPRRRSHSSHRRRARLVYCCNVATAETAAVQQRQQLAGGNYPAHLPATVMPCVFAAAFVDSGTGVVVMQHAIWTIRFAEGTTARRGIAKSPRLALAAEVRTAQRVAIVVFGDTTHIAVFSIDDVNEPASTVELTTSTRLDAAAAAFHLLISGDCYCLAADDFSMIVYRNEAMTLAFRPSPRRTNDVTGEVWVPRTHPDKVFHQQNRPHPLGSEETLFVTTTGDVVMYRSHFGTPVLLARLQHRPSDADLGGRVDEPSWDQSMVTATVSAPYLLTAGGPEMCIKRWNLMARPPSESLAVRRLSRIASRAGQLISNPAFINQFLALCIVVGVILFNLRISDVITWPYLLVLLPYWLLGIAAVTFMWHDAHTIVVLEIEQHAGNWTRRVLHWYVFAVTPFAAAAKADGLLPDASWARLLLPLPLCLLHHAWQEVILWRDAPNTRVPLDRRLSCIGYIAWYLSLAWFLLLLPLSYDLPTASNALAIAGVSCYLSCTAVALVAALLLWLCGRRREAVYLCYNAVVTFLRSNTTELLPAATHALDDRRARVFANYLAVTVALPLNSLVMYAFNLGVPLFVILIPLEALPVFLILTTLVRESLERMGESDDDDDD